MCYQDEGLLLLVELCVALSGSISFIKVTNSRCKLTQVLAVDENKTKVIAIDEI